MRFRNVPIISNMGLNPTFSILLWLLSFPKRCLCFGVHLIIWVIFSPLYIPHNNFFKKGLY